MKKTVKRGMNQKYTVFTGGKISMNSYSVQLALHHMMNGILPCSIYSMDQQQAWSCEHTGKIGLEEYCRKNELKKVDVLWILEGLIKNMQEIQEYLLDMDSLYMEISEIYIDPLERRVWNIYIPFYKEPVWDHMKNLMQFLLGRLDQQDTQAVHLLYGVYQYLAQGGTETEKIWELLCEKNVEQESTEVNNDENEYVSKELREYIAQEKVKKIDSYSERNMGEMVSGQKTVSYSYVRWIMVAFPLAAALFVFGFVTLNEWYLSDKKKILLMLTAGGLICLSLFLWKRWGAVLHKKNPLDADESISGKTVTEPEKTSTPM